MIKYCCDRCGKETTNGVYNTVDNTLTDLCESCSEKYGKLHLNPADFLRFSDEEIDFLLNTFKVGDKVITDDGRTGTITDICTCDRCKKRGFYEPKVQMDIGVCQIWITDTDKENGFRSFYQIGDRVFGNVDKEASEYILQRIEELEHELTEYEEQLEVVRELKENNNGN